MMGQAIGAVVQAAAVANHEEPGDYTGEDGLLYCGKCHTPKQVRIASVFLKRDAPLPCMCKCKSEAWDREKQNKARLEHYERAVSSQLVRIDNRSVREWTFERDDGKNQDISSLARKYVDDWKLYRDKGQGLLLWGNVGTGKSYMAACISNALRERQIPTLFIAEILFSKSTDSKADSGLSEYQSEDGIQGPEQRNRAAFLLPAMSVAGTGTERIGVTER